ncbi:MAG TPA: alpha/beta hydrolase [Cytophagaceae bacterium]|jgi:acetyl esterase/lipase
MIRFLFLTGLLVLGFKSSQAQEKIYLWPEGAPFAMGAAEEDKPSITAYFAPKDKATGAAVIICPGGGYVTLAASHEGDSVAQWFNKLGITAFVLRYRVGTWDHKKYQHPVPFMDATRAMRIVRSRAKEWSINREKIGIMGFSAGGHLASTVATRFDGGNSKSKNSIDKQSSRPNFLVLVYPVITLNTKYAFRFGRGVLLGDNASQASIDSLSNETQVTSLTPPTFLMHSNDDGVYPENSVLFYMALREANVPAELHIYERGGHGYGLGRDPITSTWPDRLRDWLRNQGLLK